MISEEICLAVLGSLHGGVSTYTTRHNAGQSTESVQEHKVTHALREAPLIRPLLARYDLADVTAAIRWLALGEYVGQTRWGVGGLWVYTLTPKGLSAASKKSFGDDRRFLYQDLPYQVFLAHQFRDEDADLEVHLVARVLQPAGYAVVDGRADGMEQFRTSILAKIRASRSSFVC